MERLINDPFFKVETLASTPRPNLVSYLAMHQDYSEEDVYSELDKLTLLTEKELGDRLIRHCISKMHMGPLEHPTITFNIIGFPHSVIAQATRHRIATFDIQSNRYTSKRLLVCNELLGDVGDHLSSAQQQLLEKYFYFRPIGEYKDREANNYYYSQSYRHDDMKTTALSLKRYAQNVEEFGFAPEHARDVLTYNFRQHGVCSFNCRSLLHFLDMRTPLDAQIEIRTLAQLMFERLEEWMPEIAVWYKKHRFAKNKLSP